MGTLRNSLGTNRWADFVDFDNLLVSSGAQYVWGTIVGPLNVIALFNKGGTKSNHVVFVFHVGCLWIYSNLISGGTMKTIINPIICTTWLFSQELQKSSSICL